MAPSVPLPFAIQEPEVSGDGVDTVIEQHERTRGKLPARRTPFVETITQGGTEQHEADSFYHSKSM
jgi:hypothetical protein